MPISTLQITHFRNLVAASLHPCEFGLNIICGANGSGKTSLLEAIYYLGLGKSFRSSSASRLVQHKQPKFSLFSQVLNEGDCLVPVGVERDTDGGTRLRVAEKEVTSQSELAGFMPMRLINSQSHHLFESGPAFRRKYLDWGLFYQVPGFYTAWRHFERALKQRNAVLRQHKPKRELDIWTNEVVKHGNELNQLRTDYISLLLPELTVMTHELLGVTNLKMRYESGWDSAQSYAGILEAHYQDDYYSGHTQHGPHRADFDLTLNGLSVKHFLSRGQQKLLICAMILAQGLLLAKSAKKGLIYLVDDLPSELDEQSRQKLISLLSKQSAQVFITAIESASVCELIDSKCTVPLKVFHVEHGEVVEQKDTSEFDREVTSNKA